MKQMRPYERLCEIDQNILRVCFIRRTSIDTILGVQQRIFKRGTETKEYYAHIRIGTWSATPDQAIHGYSHSPLIYRSALYCVATSQPPQG